MHNLKIAGASPAPATRKLWHTTAMLETDSAGGVIMNRKDKVVLVKNGPSFWGFPKGHVDEGEDLIMAARREIREETGLSNIVLVKELWPYTRFKGALDGGDDTSELKEIHMFLFTTDEDTLAPVDPGNPEARWVPIHEVANLLTHPKDREFFESIKDSLK